MTNQPRPGGHSPWGPIQTVEPLGPLACVVHTAGHGGIWVAPEGMTLIPAALRTTVYSPGPWFEEDCDWAIPYLYLNLGPQDAFKNQTEAAITTLKNWLPEALKETAHG